MPRLASAQIIRQLTKLTGTEPFIVIGLMWDDFTINWYGTRDFSSPGFNVEGRIIEIGNIRSAKRADSMGTTSSVSLTLNDTDGKIKFFLDRTQVEQRQAVIFHSDVAITSDQMVQILRGKIVGPVDWNEGNRTVTLNIESQVDSQELGFAPTKQDVPDLVEEAEGMPWPMVFGECYHVPALLARKHATGNLIFPIRLFVDPPNNFFAEQNFTFVNSIATEIVKNSIFIEGNFPTGNITLSIEGVLFKGAFEAGSTEFKVAEANIPKYIDIAFGARDNADVDVNNERVAWLVDSTVISGHHCYCKLEGEKTEFHNYCVRQVGKKCWFRYKFVIKGQSAKIKSGVIKRVYQISMNGMVVDASSYINRVSGGVNRNLGLINSTMNKLRDDANSWWQADVESEVRLWDQNDPDIYIASAVKLSSITTVYGRKKIKTLDGKSKTIFAPVPTDWYEVKLSSYTVGALTASSLTFKTPITDRDSSWDDQIYVSGVSTVGPNPVDIIQWILTNFTELEVDSTFKNFRNNVFVKANFALFDLRDALKVCQEIAFQAGIGLIVDSDFASMRLLRKPPSNVLFLNEFNIEKGSLSLGFTPTIDIITKTIGSWSETYRDQPRLNRKNEHKNREVQRIINSLVPAGNRRFNETRYRIYTENIDTYGTRSREEHFFIFNNEDDVSPILTFWGHRFANSYRRVRCKTTLAGVLFQVWDGVTFNFTSPELSVMNVKGLIESVDYDYKDKSVTLEIVLPIKAGNILDSEFYQ